MDIKLLRPLSTDSLIIPGLKLKPTRYSKRAQGGPYRAEISGDGDDLAMWNGISALGVGVEIYSEKGDRVWWGQLHEAVLTVGAVTIRASLDNLANRIKLAYTLIDPISGEKTGKLETPWEYDGDSILRYGLREMVFSADGLTDDTEALAYRHNLLLAMKDPKPTLDMAGGGTPGGPATLTFYCRGWWETLDTRYFKRTFSEYGYREIGPGIFRFGMSTTYQKVAMSFQVGATDTYKYVQVGLSKTAPTDTVVCKIYTDSGGSPNTLHKTSEAIDASALITDVWTWVTFNFLDVIDLVESTTYWIVIERTGSLSDTNFYTVNTNTAGTYAEGTVKYHNGSAWAAPTTAQDMEFTISTGSLDDAVDSTALIETIIEEYGPITEVNTAEVLDTSGISVSPSRDGSKTALAEIIELLEKGSTNYRRMLARVRENKRVEIYEEPAATASGYINREGDAFDLYGSPLRPETCPVAMWLNLKGVVPLGASFGTIGPETCFFAEESEFDATTGKCAYRPADRSGGMNFMIVGNG